MKTITSLIGVLLLGLFAPALAVAEWTAPTTLSGAGRSAFFPQVAVDAKGNAVFTWLGSDGANSRVEARSLSAAGVLSPVQTLSPRGQSAFDPQVAVDADGDAVFTWRRFDGTNHRVQARARSAAGTLSRVQTLSDPGQSVFDPQVGVDAGGNAVFAWRRSDGAHFRAQARARSAAGVLSPVQTLSDPGESAHEFRLAVGRDGDAAVAWMRTDGAYERLQARVRSAAGTLGPVKDLSKSGQFAGQPRVAVDPEGDAVIAWQGFDGTNARVETRSLSAAGALSAVQSLSDPLQHATYPEVALDAQGDAVFAWRRFDGVNHRVQARARSAAGTLSPVQTLSDPWRDAAEPQVAVDADGDALFAWSRSDGAVPRIEARSRSAAGALRPFTTLSDPGQDATSPRVALSPAGEATLIWRRYDGTNGRAQTSSGP